MSQEHEYELDYRFLVVGERPFCIWDPDIRSRSLSYFDSVDAEFFLGVARLLDSHIKEEPDAASQHAALVLRMVYSQALETLFALIGAALQAPYAVPAWLNLYRNSDLADLVSKISNREPIRSAFPALRQRPCTWKTVANLLLENLVLEDKEKERRTKEGFEKLWARFAMELVDEDTGREYNSIKHGLRARPGGFALAMGLEEQPGIPPPESAMRLVGQSDYGTSFSSVTSIDSSARHHVQHRRHSRNWSPQDIQAGLALVSISVANVISALRILNDVPAQECPFGWPPDLESFDEPWKRRTGLGVLSVSGFEVVLPLDYIKPYTKHEILSNYDSGKGGGRAHIHFPHE